MCCCAWFTCMLAKWAVRALSCCWMEDIPAAMVLFVSVSVLNAAELAAKAFPKLDTVSLKVVSSSSFSKRLLP